jgi:hypothetical protein
VPPGSAGVPPAQGPGALDKNPVKAALTRLARKWPRMGGCLQEKDAGGTPALPGGNPWPAKCRSEFCKRLNRKKSYPRRPAKDDIGPLNKALEKAQEGCAKGTQGGQRRTQGTKRIWPRRDGKDRGKAGRGRFPPHRDFQE